MSREIALQLFLDEKGFVFDTEHVFRGLTISETSGGFNCVIRAASKAGDPVYAMTTAVDAQEGFNKLYDALSKGNGATLWRHDRYAASRGGE